MEKEIWKSLEGLVQYGENYSVSTVGRVTSNRRNKILRYNTSKDGYLSVALSSKCKVKRYKIHRLVALAFIPNPENKAQVNHKDGVKNNNQVTNLEWATPSENIQHAFDNRLIIANKGEDAPASRLREEQVTAIKILLSQEVPITDIASNFDVAESTISFIKRGDSWAHIHVDGFTPSRDRKGLKGERSHQAKLTDGLVTRIRELHKTGDYSYSKLATQFNIHKTTIGRIVTYKIWKHLP